MMMMMMMMITIIIIITRAAIGLKILIVINRAIKILNRDYSRLIAPDQETQVCGTE